MYSLNLRLNSADESENIEIWDLGQSFEFFYNFSSLLCTMPKLISNGHTDYGRLLRYFRFLQEERQKLISNLRFPFPG